MLSGPQIFWAIKIAIRESRLLPAESLLGRIVQVHGVIPAHLAS